MYVLARTDVGRIIDSRRWGTSVEGTQGVGNTRCGELKVWEHKVWGTQGVGNMRCGEHKVWRTQGVEKCDCTSHSEVT